MKVEMEALKKKKKKKNQGLSEVVKRGKNSWVQEDIHN